MMTAEDQDRLARGKAASEAGRMAETYSLLMPLAEAGHAEAQGIVGSLMMVSVHRYDTIELATAGPAVDVQTAQTDREQAARFLKAASDKGYGPASFNLASMHVDGLGVGTWEERKARAAELYALAQAQGFTAFGWLMNGTGPGQPYLDLMERHEAGEVVPCPWADPAATDDRAG